MNSPFASINLKEIAQSAGLAFVGAILNAVYQLVNTCVSFSCFKTFDWYGMIQAAFMVGISAVFAHLITTKDGKLGGVLQIK